MQERASGLLVKQLCVGDGVCVADETDPVGLEVGGEIVTSLLVDVLDGEGFVVHPVTVAGDVDLGGDLTGGGNGDYERFFVVAGHEVGVGGDSGFDLGVEPRAAFSDGFPEAPEVVDGAGPEGGLVVGGVNDVGIMFGGVF